MKYNRRNLKDKLGNNIVAPTTIDMCYEASTGKTQQTINSELKARIDYLESILTLSANDPERIRVRPLVLSRLENGWGIVTKVLIGIPSVEIIADKYIRVYYGYLYESIPVITLGPDRVVSSLYRVYINSPQVGYCDIGFMDNNGREILISNINALFDIQIMVAGR